MSDKLRVSCSAMKSDGEKLAAELKEIPQIIERLHNSVKSLAACWDGPAWASYQNQVNKDIENMKEVYGTLVQLQKALGTGRDTYLKTEFDIYTDIKGLWI